MNIIVNGRIVPIKAIQLSYKDIVSFVADTLFLDDIFTVTYRHGVPPFQFGTLAPGESVLVQNGMVFNVADTSRS